MNLPDDTQTLFRPPTEAEDAGIDSPRRRGPGLASLLRPGQQSGQQSRVDRFALLELIAKGGMGELYAAYDAKLDRKIALKLVRAGRGGHKADSRLVREAQALAQIAHPNVVSVFEVGLADERVFVAMEYVRGQTLSAWLVHAGDLPEAERVPALLRHFRDAALGLEAVHQAGLAHRDFKPDNVIVSADGRVRLVDFGLARSTHELTDDPSASQPTSDQAVARVEDDEDLLLTPDVEVGTLTNTGTLLGTPRYMAPEQWQVRRGDSRSDQFGFCVALYHALHGQWPFDAGTMTELSAAVIRDPPREPPRKPEVPARLQAALLRGLAKQPDARHPDMRELIAAIEEAVAPPRQRRSTWLLLLVLLLTLLLAAWAWRLGEGTGTHSGEGAIARVEREAEAEQRRLLVAGQIAALDAQGKLDEADEVFAAFAGLPRYADTRAMARAWLDQAARMATRGDDERQRLALGEALLASPTDARRGAALMALARVQTRAHEYEQLGATLLVLDDADPDAELLTMRIQEAVYRRDLRAALALASQPAVAALDREIGPLLRQLDRVSTTAWVVAADDPHQSAIVTLPNLDLDGDRHGELLLLPPAGPARVLASRPELTSLHTIALEGEPDFARKRAFIPVAHAPVAPGGPVAPSWAVLLTGSQQLLLELARIDDQIAVRRRLEIENNQWAFGDLFTARGWEGWEGFGSRPSARRLTGLRGGGDGAVQDFVPDPSLAAVDSFIGALTIADLDGNGGDELIAVVDGWWAYDVRVLSPGQQPGSFELAARRKLGGQAGVVSFPAPNGRGHWLASSVPETHPSPRVFPPEAPAGVAPGLYILAWAGPGAGIEIVDQLPLPNNARPGAGDFDGDGRYEVVVQLQGAIVIMRPGAEAAGAEVWLDGLAYHAIADLDHDGDDELIVSELDGGRVLVLGAGPEHLTPLPQLGDPRVEPPPGLDPDLRGRWRRAEILAMIGQVDQASAAFAEIANLAGKDEAVIARRRAAELLDAQGARLRAANLYERAGDLPSRERALELFVAIHRFAEAARVADSLAAAPRFDEATRARWRTRAQALHLRASPADQLDIDFTRPLDADWRIARPGVLHSEAKGLRIDSIGAAAPLLLRRDFVWGGDHLALEADVEIERLEWGAALRFELVPVDELGQATGPALAQARLASVGGGGHFVFDRSDDHRLEPDSDDESPRMMQAQPAPGQRHVHLRIDVTADAPSSWVEVTTSGDDQPPRSLAYHNPIALEARRPGRYQLRISAGVEPWMRGVFVLERLRLAGAHDLRPAPVATHREQILRALANDDDAQALALLDAAEAGEFAVDDRAWLRALALEQLGQWSQAVPELALALGRCESDDALSRFGYALLLQPDRFGPTLRELCPREQFLLATWTVAWSALFHHPDLAQIHRTMTTQAVDLDRCQPRDFAQAMACADLLTARSRGWFMQNLRSAAESDLRQAIEVGEAWLARSSSTEEQRRRLSRLVALAHVRLAAVQMTSNHTAEAADELALALDTDQAPEIIADVIIARSFFQPLESTPIWTRILATQSGLPALSTFDSPRASVSQ